MTTHGKQRTCSGFTLLNVCQRNYNNLVLSDAEAMKDKMFAFVWLVVAFTDINFSSGQQQSKSMLLRKAMETAVLPFVYPNCSSVDFKSEHFTCQIRCLSDETHLMCLDREACTLMEQRPVVSCPDGSIQKTCIKVSKGEEYVCACQSAPRAFHQGGEQFHWTSDWDPTIPNIESGNVFYRRLCHDNDNEAQCVAEEKIHLHYLVAHLDISDDAISASSYFENRDDHGPKRVRLGVYTSYRCGWVPSLSDPTPWVQFDMGVAVTVWGLLLKKRCDPPSYNDEVLSCDVTFSHDGDAWMTAAENLVTSYPDGTISVAWLHHPISGRYWRIHPLTWVEHPSMKADLIGR